MCICIYICIYTYRYIESLIFARKSVSEKRKKMTRRYSLIICTSDEEGHDVRICFSRRLCRVLYFLVTASYASSSRRCTRSEHYRDLAALIE